MIYLQPLWELPELFEHYERLALTIHTHGCLAQVTFTHQERSLWSGDGLRQPIEQRMLAFIERVTK